MFEFGDSQKKRRHKKALNFDLTLQARTARAERKKAVKQAARLAELKRKSALTKSTRETVSKQKRFKALKKEVLAELRATLKSLQSSEAKFKARFAELEVKTEALSAMSDTISVSISESDIDFNSSVDSLSYAIEEIAAAAR